MPKNDAAEVAPATKTIYQETLHQRVVRLPPFSNIKVITNNLYLQFKKKL
jgi:hypothetical protein